MSKVLEPSRRSSASCATGELLRRGHRWGLQTKYPPEIRIIRLMCTGRVDLAFVFRAFAKGADGVFIGGCWPGECHYVTEGNYDALGNMHLIAQAARAHRRSTPNGCGWSGSSASEGMRFAEVMTIRRPAQRARPARPGRGHRHRSCWRSGSRPSTSCVPYIKLVERERLRVRGQDGGGLPDLLRQRRGRAAVSRADRTDG